MSAGNSSNTIFQAIPVGEDFKMSFSTERFFHTIVPADVLNVVFKLYDARLIGNVGNPNPNAVIETVSYSVTPARFSIGTSSISIQVYSSTLDAYEAARPGSTSSIFRGELYGYAELTVGGAETGDLLRLDPAPASASMSTSANLGFPTWDGNFYPGDANCQARLTASSANLIV
jgi:hypothetical protein